MPASSRKKRNKLSLRYDHYLYIVALFLALFLAFYTTYPASGAALFGTVLSDNDDRSDDDNSGSDDDEDDEEDEKEDEDEEDDEDKDNDEDKKEEERKKIRKNESLNSGSRKSETNKVKTREVIQNPDGTTSEIRREVKNGETKVEIKTYDANGNKIEEYKEETKDGESEIKDVVRDPVTGEKISETRLKTEDGKGLELRVREGTESSRVRFNAEKQELIVKNSEHESEDENELDDSNEPSLIRIRAEGDSFLVQRSGVNAEVDFPITVDEETGQIFVTTPNGNVELKSMPDTITQKAADDNSFESVDDVNIEIDDDKAMSYVISGVKSEEFLGTFTVKIPSRVVYNAETGEFVKSETPFVYRILDLFTF